MIIRRARGADAPGIARVGVDTWRTTYGGMIPDDYLNNLSYERSEIVWGKRISEPDTFVYVCESDAGEVVGYACGGPERNSDLGYGTELYAIYVLKAHQGEGIGRQLLRAVAQHVVGNGCNSLLIWVLSANPSSGFYKRLGGERLGTQMIEIGGCEIEETAYGWKDLSCF